MSRIYVPENRASSPLKLRVVRAEDAPNDHVKRFEVFVNGTQFEYRCMTKTEYDSIPSDKRPPAILDQTGKHVLMRVEV